jgi:hypothetical protein
MPNLVWVWSWQQYKTLHCKNYLVRPLRPLSYIYILRICGSVLSSVNCNCESDWWDFCVPCTRHTKLPSLPENSDDEDESEEDDKSSVQTSSAGTRSSYRLRSHALHESTSPLSQASTIHVPSAEVSNWLLLPPPPQTVICYCKNMSKNRAWT